MSPTTAAGTTPTTDPRAGQPSTPSPGSRPRTAAPSRPLTALAGTLAGMNAALVAGCALGGALIGAALDVAAARVPPSQDPVDEAVAATPMPRGDSALAPAPAASEADRPVAQPPSEAPGPAGPGSAAGGDAGPVTRPVPGPPGPVELVATAVVTAVLLAAAAVRFGPVPELAPYCVLFAGLMGAGLGWLGLADVYVGFLSGFVIGALMGTVKMLAQGTGRKTRFPFAPALACGTVIGVLWGSWLASYWVLHT